MTTQSACLVALHMHDARHCKIYPWRVRKCVPPGLRLVSESIALRYCLPAANLSLLAPG
jgi:hypothetical protein